MINSPPRDESGEVLPHNHDEILESHILLRRVPSNWVVDDPRSGKRISTMAFQPSSGKNGGLSVDIEFLILSSGVEPRSLLNSSGHLGVLSFQVGDVRQLGFSVGYDPLPDNPFHGEVWGNFSRPNKKKLLQLSSWYVPIDGVTL